MADLFGAATTSTSPPEQEEISAFFNQFLHGSSSSSSASRVRFRPLYDHSLQSPPPPPPPPPPHDALSAIVSLEDRGRVAGSVCRTQLVSRGGDGNSGSGADLSSSSGFDVADHGAYLASSMKDMTDNTTSSAGDLSCDSEKRPEVSGIPSSTVRPRSSSKRSRAAEVHNMSEKRRRSRINERMKALQKLIPNSNKTDKASMLDEAIEYLKQLQLQVQMLSMRNGLSLYPVCLPGVLYPVQLHPTGMSYHEGNEPSNSKLGTRQFSATGETSAQSAFDFSNQCLYQKEPNTPHLLTDIAETQFGFEPSSHANYGSFNLGTSSEKEICEDNKQLV